MYKNFSVYRKSSATRKKVSKHMYTQDVDYGHNKLGVEHISIWCRFCNLPTGKIRLAWRGSECQPVPLPPVSEFKCRTSWQKMLSNHTAMGIFEEWELSMPLFDATV